MRSWLLLFLWWQVNTMEVAPLMWVVVRVLEPALQPAPLSPTPPSNTIQATTSSQGEKKPDINRTRIVVTLRIMGRQRLLMERNNLDFSATETNWEVFIDRMKFWRYSQLYGNVLHRYGVPSSQPSGYSQAYPSTQQYPPNYTSQAGTTPPVPASSAQPVPPPAGPRPQMRWLIWCHMMMIVVF